MEGRENMGMRPQMHLVFGVDDFCGHFAEGVDIWEDRLYIPEKEVEEEPYEMLFLRDRFRDCRSKEWHIISSVLFYDPEFSPGILGLVLDSADYDSTIVRVLSMFHAEYFQAGKKDLPVWEKEERPLYAKRAFGSKCGDIEFQPSWFYPGVVEQHIMWPVHAYCARWLFQQVGVDIDYHRYKAMLVWQWS
jgi:hypothetical protein